MKIGDVVYIRYIGNIRHWNRDLFHTRITWIGSKHLSVEINGKPVRFEKATSRHDNRGHQPAYQLFHTMQSYEETIELSDLKSLIARTDFTRLPIDKQRAIKAIIDS